MPLNILRLNQRQHHPNDRITFIKPLPSPATQDRADLFLRKIAAICYPIMKAHSLSVTTLEEFPPNREFMGRNFNGGEVIQLVLRRMPHRRPDLVARHGQSAATGSNGQGDSSTSSRPHGITVSNNVGRIDPHSSDFVAEYDDGGWLPLKTVQMVMMHELAHCIEMNHSKAFWAVRNEYVVHLKVLWSRAYTGEGMWGRGQALDTGQWNESGAGGADGFEDLCGGAYRGRGRRGKRGRKGKEQVSYAERKRRKLEKVEGKFGKGEKIGEDENRKLLLEGKVVGTKPRVANSKRGRDLRAAAALARFEIAKVEKAREDVKVEEVDDDETESESGSETESEDGDALLDEHGKTITDSQGHDLRKVCGDTDADGDANARDELAELNHVGTQPTPVDDPSEGEADAGTMKRPAPETNVNKATKPVGRQLEAQDDSSTVRRVENGTSHTDAPSSATSTVCSVCSLENEPGSATCLACSNVLDKRAVTGSWRCGSDGCKASGYTNAGDAGVCGICGQPKGAG